VGHDTVPSRLPVGVLEGLRRAFAEEVRTRLPRLESLEDLVVACRDAHTLGSSAWVVGENEIGRLARAVEADLQAGPRSELIAALRDYLDRTPP
jgi:hypothetical protein